MVGDTRGYTDATGNRFQKDALDGVRSGLSKGVAPANRDRYRDAICRQANR